VAERCVAQIMSETDSFHEILIEAHGSCDCSRNLRDF